MKKITANSFFLVFDENVITYFENDQTTANRKNRKKKEQWLKNLNKSI